MKLYAISKKNTQLALAPNGEWVPIGCGKNKVNVKAICWFESYLDANAALVLTDPRASQILSFKEVCRKAGVKKARSGPHESYRDSRLYQLVHLNDSVTGNMGEGEPEEARQGSPSGAANPQTSVFSASASDAASPSSDDELPGAPAAPVSLGSSYDRNTPAACSSSNVDSNLNTCPASASPADPAPAGALEIPAALSAPDRSDTSGNLSSPADPLGPEPADAPAASDRPSQEVPSVPDYESPPDQPEPPALDTRLCLHGESAAFSSSDLLQEVLGLLATLRDLKAKWPEEQTRLLSSLRDLERQQTDLLHLVEFCEPDHAGPLLRMLHDVRVERRKKKDELYALNLAQNVLSAVPPSAIRYAQEGIWMLPNRTYHARYLTEQNSPAWLLDLVHGKQAPEEPKAS